MKLEKSAQPVSEFELAAGEELQPVSAEGGDGGDGTAAPAAVDVPVSIGMSSKLAVHTGPWGGKNMALQMETSGKALLYGAGSPNRCSSGLQAPQSST